MKREFNETTQLERAQARVNQIKGFHNHLTTYIFVNAALFLFAKRMTFILLSKEALGNPGFLEWINWNVYGTPIIWGVALIIHALYVFVPSPFKKWEEKKIKAYMDEERSKTDKFV
ncbi:2TM domain-containing protein [Croceitalea rosinachiae]|uniref:2TM domain-containing protein n=1 Tax=Croceitalea rosinachiae TaxID=3075596 RepID=A0ABU3AA95_9FLAO|nr:2TM domain-containing protein [Croceitalea sp. F388]MDT0607106.1 2TM domain-containing protein [Croceitalea sp. F388]